MVEWRRSRLSPSANGSVHGGLEPDRRGVPSRRKLSQDSGAMASELVECREFLLETDVLGPRMALDAR